MKNCGVISPILVLRSYGIAHMISDLVPLSSTPARANAKERVSLGHEFITNVLKIQFKERMSEGQDPISFAYSLAYAIVEGAAEVLEVPSTDLNVTVHHIEQQPIPPIILYDNVPGGAGLVMRLEEKELLMACLKAALKRVIGECGCDEGTSCYGCLRSYRNQFVHESLQRGPVKEYLQKIIHKL